MTQQTIWQENFEVRSHETDFMLRWKPAAFLRVMEEITVHHSFHLGVDYYSLKEMNLAWILVRTKIRFYEFPPVGTRIIVQTWPRGWQQKIFGMRDYSLNDDKGKSIAHATTAWLLVNTRTRRLVKPETLSVALPDNEGRFILDETLEKLTHPTEMSEQHVFKARYSSLDLMGHVNNTQYVDWICDSFPLTFWRKHQFEWLQINYSNEVKPEESINITLAESNEHRGVYSAVGTNQETNLIAFEAQFCIKQSD